LGIGSSAAEAVGTIALRFERAGLSHEEYSAEVGYYAMSAHDTAQGGIGSGADIAACAIKAPIIFRRSGQDIEVEIPEQDDEYEKIPMALLWSGIPADTREYVGKFRNWAGTGDREVGQYMGSLVRISHELGDAWFNSTKSSLYKLVDEYMLILSKCAEKAGIEYKSTLHQEIELWARKHGGRAKPTGAGGGDMILLLGDLPLDELKGLIIPLNIEMD
jgi:mevalonate kinase